MTARDAAWLVKDAGLKFFDDRGQSIGASLAFYTALSLSPLLLVVVAITGAVYGEDAARGELVQQIRHVVGQEGAVVVEQLIAQSANLAHGAWPWLIAGVTLLIGASMVFTELQGALNAIWQVKGHQVEGGILRKIRAKLLSFLLVCCTAFLLLVSMVVGAALSAIQGKVAGVLPEWVELAGIVTFVLTLGVTTLLFAMIFKWLPETDLAWSDVWIGAGVTALLFSLGRYLIGLYLGQAAVGSAYGAAGAFVVLLVWVYYSTQILLFGAELTFVFAARYGSGVRAPDGEWVRNQVPDGTADEPLDQARELRQSSSTGKPTSDARVRGQTMTTNVLPESRKASQVSNCLEHESLEKRLACLADAGPEAIEERLNQLNRVWTAGRMAKITLGGTIVVGVVLAAAVSPWWLVLPGIASLALLQAWFTQRMLLSALYRRLGFKCSSEVEHEKMALKVLRGDFRNVPTVLDVENHDDISRLEGEGGPPVEEETTKVEPQEAARLAVDATQKA